MVAPTNDTAKILAAITASTDAIKAAISQSTLATATNISASTQATQAAITDSAASVTAAIVAALDASTQEILAAIAAIPATAPPDTGGGGGGGVPPTIPDTQPVWTMADATVKVTPTGHEYTFGTGPNEIKTSANFTAGKPVGFAVFVGNAANEFAKHVASGMIPASNNGTNLGDTFVFRGSYPPGCSVSINQDPTLQSGWWNFVTVDDVPYDTTGNYSGDGALTYTEVFDSKNVNMKWTPTGQSSGGGGGGGGGTPTVTETKTSLQITDKAGVVRQIGPDILSKLAAQITANDIDVRVLADCKTVGAILPAVPPPGFIFGGPEGTRIKIDVTGFQQSQMLQQGAGVFIFPPATGSKQAALVNMEIFGAHIPLAAGGNIPAIREKTTAGVMPSLVINAKNLYIHDNDDGCLIGCFNQENCILERNGGAPNKTHNSYSWDQTATQIIKDTVSISPTVGYVEKTRCQKSIVTNLVSRSDQQNTAGGSAGYDYAMGGDHVRSGCKTEHTPNVADNNIIRFLTEQPAVLAPLNRLKLDDAFRLGGGTVTIENGTGTTIIDPEAKLDLTGASVVDISAGSKVMLQGWKPANVTNVTPGAALPPGFLFK